MVVILALGGVGLFIMLAYWGGPTEGNLPFIVYTMAAFVCWCRISMFSLKIDCFRARSANTTKELMRQWYFATAGWFVAAALVTAITLWPTWIYNGGSPKRDEGTSLKFMPSAALLWLYFAQSVAWYRALRRKRTHVRTAVDEGLGLRCDA